MHEPNAACARRVSALRSGRAGVAALTAIAGTLMYAGYVTGYDPLHPQPPLPAGFAERMALAKALPAPAAVAALRRETGLGAVLVHAGPGNRKRRTWLALAERGRADLQLVARDGDSLLFAVGAAPE